MIPTILSLPLVVYTIALWRLSTFSKLEKVPFYLGGYFTPHGLQAVHSKAFLPVVFLWYIFLVAIAGSPPFLKETAEWHSWAEILPIVGMSFYTLLFTTFILLFRKVADRHAEETLANAPKPYIPYPEDEYGSCLIGANEEAELIPLLQHPEIAPNISMTPFPGPVREVASDFVRQVRELVPKIRVQPLHPELGKDIAIHIQQLEETATTQAEKALDANSAFQESKNQIAELENSLAELQKSNETLNNKLLSIRTRSRGAGGAGGDFGKMTRQELDMERDRLMDTLRHLDDERRRKAAPPSSSPSE